MNSVWIDTQNLILKAESCKTVNPNCSKPPYITKSWSFVIFKSFWHALSHLPITEPWESGIIILVLVMKKLRLHGVWWLTQGWVAGLGWLRVQCTLSLPHSHCALTCPALDNIKRQVWGFYDVNPGEAVWFCWCLLRKTCFLRHIWGSSKCVQSIGNFLNNGIAL